MEIVPQQQPPIMGGEDLNMPILIPPMIHQNPRLIRQPAFVGPLGNIEQQQVEDIIREQEQQQ